MIHALRNTASQPGAHNLLCTQEIYDIVFWRDKVCTADMIGMYMDVLTDDRVPDL